MKRWLVLGSALALATSAFSYETVSIRRGSVIPIVFESSLNSNNARTGDRIFARVDRDRDLPDGLRLEGRVVRVERPRDDRGRSDRDRDDRRATAVQVEFTRIEVDRGEWRRIDAVPVKLNDRDYRRTSNGRLEARRMPKREEYVAGGVIGGFLLGSLIKKPFEGTFTGALVGILLSETEGRNGSATIIERGQKMGALLRDDLRLNLRDWNPRDRDFDFRDRDDRDEFPWREDDRFEDEVRFRVGGRPLEFQRGEKPYREGRTWMVPLNETARQLGLSSDYDDRTGRIFVEGDDIVAVLRANQREYRFNGSKRTLDEAVDVRSGQVFVPLSLFEKFFDED